MQSVNILFTAYLQFKKFPFAGNSHNYGNFCKIEIDGIL